MKKIAFLTSSALVFASFAATPLRAQETPNDVTAAKMAQQCATILASKASNTATSTFTAAVTGGQSGVAGTTSDVGAEYDVTNKRPQGTPNLTDHTVTSTALHLNGGSQNLFGKGIATATYANYLYDAKQGTTTPITFTFGCSVTETIVLPDIQEQSEQVKNAACLADVAKFKDDMKVYRAAEREFDKWTRDGGVGTPPTVPALPSLAQWGLTNPNEDHVGVDDCPSEKNILVAGQTGGTSSQVRVDLASSDLTEVYDKPDWRPIVDKLSSEQFVDLAFPLDNLLACISPDSLGGLWVNKHNFLGSCSEEAKRLNVVLSFKRR